MDAVRWLDEREAQAWRALRLMELQLTARLASELAADAGLSYPDYVVLVALTDQPEGRLRANELGCTLGWEQSRVSHHISRMVGRGFVTKEKCSSDRRGAHIVVTPRGRDVITAAAPGHVAAVRRLFLDHVTPAQLDAIGAAATTVLAVLAHDEAAVEAAAATSAEAVAGGA